MRWLQVYYWMKPAIPRWAQLLMRRAAVGLRLRRIGDTWPILESAGRRPEHWEGWPDGRRFAFVLSHDVEQARGRDACRSLVELEERLGFRSSFNFVPRRYHVPAALRAELARRGFEVGVHGLYHDGRLFKSRQIFAERAQAINAVIRDWGATGFRSPSMVRNLDWIGQLDIAYDSSIFDTDPFEPQPLGAQTIFPFRVVSQAAQREYIELPYTLPQDFTAFVLFRKDGLQIWKRKLAWIAERGGLALLNTHPDYMDFGTGRSRMDQYPAAHYRDFLEWVKTEYAGQYWHALPRDAARAAAERNLMTVLGEEAGQEGALRYRSADERARMAAAPPAPAAADTPLPEGAAPRILMIVFSHYPSDPRVRRAAEALVEAGKAVDIICLKDEGRPAVETIRGVRVFRLPVSQKRAKKSRYLYEYGMFLVLSFLKAAALHARYRYRVVHVHNMPDALVFSALVPRLTGARVVLDLHDPTPEVFMTKFGVDQTNRQIRLLMKVERWAIRFADLVLTTNKAFVDLFVSRGCPPGKIHIVMNSPQEHLFSAQQAPARPAAAAGGRRFVLMYHGLIVERHGLDTAVNAVALLRDYIPGLEFHVFGPGDAFVDTFLDLVQERGVGDLVTYHGGVPLEEIARYIHTIDLGLVPNKKTPFTDVNFPTRIFEYLAVGKSVIAPRTIGICDYFDEGSLHFFEAGHADELAGVIRRVYEHPEERAAVLERGIAVYRRHMWSAEKKRLIDLYDNLLAPASAKGRRL